MSVLDEAVNSGAVRLTAEWVDELGPYDLIRHYPNGMAMYQAYTRSRWRTGGDKLSFDWRTVDGQPFITPKRPHITPYIVLESEYSDYDHAITFTVVTMEQHTCEKCGHVHTVWPEWLQDAIEQHAADSE